jgi:predicted tellurium resistance membrane protein TerC
MEFVIALLTLTFLEIVLGIDNIIFVSLVTNKLPNIEQKKARLVGLSMALIMRILLLITIVWLIKHLTSPLFPLEGLTKNESLKKMEETKGFFDTAYLVIHTIGVREIILAAGGLFLLVKSVSEIHHIMEGEPHGNVQNKSASFYKTVVMIVMLDIVFSFDSILTAVGITDDIYAMVIAVTIAMIIMLRFSKTISSFISEHPTVEMLALAFLILIGFMLILEGVCIEVPKGYIYFGVFFSFGVELLNMRMRKVHSPDKFKHKIE